MPISLTLIVSLLKKAAKGVLKFLLVVSFLAVLVSFGIWFVSFITDAYGIVTNAAGSFGSQSLPDLMGCILSALGIDTFVTSLFAIWFSAMAFWGTAVSYIIAFNLGKRAYGYIMKGLT